MFMLKSFQLMEKICIKNMDVLHSFEKMKPQLCSFSDILLSLLTWLNKIIS